jgi:glycogen synthase
MMTPGDFASLQEGREGLSTEDYIAWKLPYVSHHPPPITKTDTAYSEEEDPEEYPFPLTLKLKIKSPGPSSPALNGPVNGIS